MILLLDLTGLLKVVYMILSNMHLPFKDVQLLSTKQYFTCNVVKAKTSLISLCMLIAA